MRDFCRSIKDFTIALESLGKLLPQYVNGIKKKKKATVERQYLPISSIKADYSLDHKDVILVCLFSCLLSICLIKDIFFLQVLSHYFNRRQYKIVT